jgi:antitoxin ParD1/3/4
MNEISISLPASLKDFIDTEVASGHFRSASDYLEALVREAEKRKSHERIEGLLVEGIRSGEATALTKQDWEGIRREVHARQSRRAGA